VILATLSIATLIASCSSLAVASVAHAHA